MSSSNVSCVLYEPNDDFITPQQSLGKYLFDCLRKRDAGEIVNIDVITGDVLTSGQLLEQSIKLTSIFKQLGIEKDDIIAIAGENIINYCVFILSALYMRVIVSPLNPLYSLGELKHALTITRAKFILCTESALENVLKIKNELGFIKTVILIGDCSESHTNVERIVIKNMLKTVAADISLFEPDDFDCSTQHAFVLSSSGTTGLPKGVTVTHLNMLTIISNLANPKYGNATSQDTSVHVLPFFHLFGLGVQLLAIASSMKLVLINKFKPDLFLQSIQDHKATKLYLVPPLLLFLAKSSQVDKYNLSSIKDVFVGAAAVGKDMQEKAAKRLVTTNIRQVYGLTECGICTMQSNSSNKMGSSGTLLPGNWAKIWDPNKKEVLGPFQTGELCFKGAMVTEGYVGDAKATMHCFDEDGFFHTGDLGYYDDDKCFYIVGRLKDLIKYKGFQVPPAEVEALILTHPGVSDCAVIGIPDERTGEVPLAYVVRQNGNEVTENEIVDFVAEKISVQKRLYGGVIFTEEIPKNATGKIVRQKLLEMFKISWKNDS